MSRLRISLLYFIFLLSCSASKDPEVYSMNDVDKMPEYPGGLQAFYEYLNKELDNPSSNDSIQVIFRFEINNHGILENISVVKGFNIEFDKRVEEVLYNSLQWSPSEKDNKKVSVYLDLPFLFLPE